MDGIHGSKAVIQLRKQVKTLSLLSTGVKIRIETIHINETIIFQRLEITNSSF